MDSSYPCRKSLIKEKNWWRISYKIGKNIQDFTLFGPRIIYTAENLDVNKITKSKLVDPKKDEMTHFKITGKYSPMNGVL